MAGQGRAGSGGMTIAIENIATIVRAHFSARVVDGRCPCTQRSRVTLDEPDKPLCLSFPCSESMNSSAEQDVFPCGGLCLQPESSNVGPSSCCGACRRRHVLRMQLALQHHGSKSGPLWRGRDCRRGKQNDTANRFLGLLDSSST